MPEIALAKVREDAPFDKICYIGCGVTTGIGAVINTAKVWPGANVAVFGLGGIGLNVIQGAKMVGADKIIGIDLNPAKRAMAEKFGLTHFINPDEVGRDKVVQAIVDLTGGGAEHQRAANCPARSVERCQDTVSGHLDDVPTVLADDLPRKPVMVVQNVAPARVAHFGRTAG